MRKPIKRRPITILAAIFILIAVSSACLLLPKPGGLPAGFAQISQVVENDYTITTYSGSGTAQDALSAFRASMESEGWTYKTSGSFGGYTGDIYERGDDRAVVHSAEAGTDQVTVVVVSGPKAPESQPSGEENEEGGPPAFFSASIRVGETIDDNRWGGIHIEYPSSYPEQVLRITVDNEVVEVRKQRDGSEYVYPMVGNMGFSISPIGRDEENRLIFGGPWTWGNTDEVYIFGSYGISPHSYLKPGETLEFFTYLYRKHVMIKYLSEQDVLEHYSQLPVQTQLENYLARWPGEELVRYISWLVQIGHGSEQNLLEYLLWGFYFQDAPSFVYQNFVVLRITVDNEVVKTILQRSTENGWVRYEDQDVEVSAVPIERTSENIPLWGRETWDTGEIFVEVTFICGSLPEKT